MTLRRCKLKKIEVVCNCVQYSKSTQKVLQVVQSYQCKLCNRTKNSFVVRFRETLFHHAIACGLLAANGGSWHSIVTIHPYRGRSLRGSADSDGPLPVTVGSWVTVTALEQAAAWVVSQTFQASGWFAAQPTGVGHGSAPGSRCQLAVQPGHSSDSLQ